MRDYVLWALRQFYLLLFWPSKFDQEAQGEEEGRPWSIRKERLAYLLKMVPWMIASAFLANALIGCAFRLSSPDPLAWSWLDLWHGTLVGIGIGLVGAAAACLVQGLWQGMTGTVMVCFVLSMIVDLPRLLGDPDLRVIDHETESLLYPLVAWFADYIQMERETGIIIYHVVVWVKDCLLEGIFYGLTIGAMISVVSRSRALVVSLVMAFAISMGILHAASRDLMPAESWVRPAVFGCVFGFAFGAVQGHTARVLRGIVYGAIVGLVVARFFGTVVGVASARPTVIDTGVEEEYYGAWEVGVAEGVCAGVSSGFACTLAFCLASFGLLSYPSNMALAGLLYFVARGCPSRVRQAWKWCPVAWNEVLWLPLPFVSRFLALLVRHDRTEGFRQIMLVATHHRLQLGAALSALVQVIRDDVRATSPADIGAAGEKLAWTTQAPLELPVEVQAALAHLAQASHQTAQYLSFSCTPREADALNLAVDEVHALQRAVVGARGRFARCLLHTANQWCEILEAEQTRIRQSGSESH